MIKLKETTPPSKREQLRKLFIANPMQMEVTRFRRRFVNVTQSPKLNQTLTGLVVFSYLLTLAIVFAARHDLPMEPLAYLQLALMLLAAIVASHAAIAGERDRRSWDLLQVAPVTQHQIVVGKFMGSATLLVAIQLLFLPMMLLTNLGGLGSLSLSLGRLGVVDLVSLSSALLFSSVTIFLSSKMKNANSTLVSAIAGGVCLYVLVPFLVAVLFPTFSILELFLAVSNPFYWIWKLMGNRVGDETIMLQPFVWVFAFILLNICLTAAALFVTGHRLTKLRSRE